MNFSCDLRNHSLLVNSTETSNQTHLSSPYSSQQTSQWQSMTVIRLILTLTSFFTNAPLLLLFLAESHLRQSAFNIYLINLLTCNVLHDVLQKPPDILNDLYPKGWPFGNVYCSVYVYFTWLLESGMRGCHGLITLNRLWAVLWPNSYRIRHSRRIAVTAVIGTWICLHAILLPGIVLDSLYYRLPLESNQCWPNLAAQPIWSQVATIVAFDAFQLIIILAFPVICFKRYRYNRSKINDRSHDDRRGQKTPATKSDDGVEHWSKVLSQSTTDGRGLKAPATKSDDGVELVSKVLSQNATKTEKSGGSHGQSGHYSSSRKQQTGAFKVLMVLTASVIICWVPTMVYYFILSYFPDTYMPPLFDRVILILLSLQSTLDPLLFVVALPDVRRTIIRLFKKSA